MRISAIQFAIRFGDVDYNYTAADRLIHAASRQGADTVVLPELWNTSFYPDNVRELADNNGKRTKAFLSDLARSCSMNIVGGSVANCHNGKLYNSTFVADRKGDIIASYDKVHLFTPGKEEQVFTAGDRMNIFELDGIKMASVICYDIRFCEWVRMAALTGAQVLFVPAAWAHPRLVHWQILNRARAIENQIFVVAVNSCGKAGDNIFCGHSAIIDPWGTVLADSQEKEQIISADIDFSIIRNIRENINVFRDRKTELYHI